MVNDIKNFSNSVSNRGVGKSTSDGHAAKKSEAAPKDQPHVAKDDSVQLTDTAKQLNAMSESVQNGPDVNSEKVKALRSQIEQGTYQIDSKKIASKMVDDMILVQGDK